MISASPADFQQLDIDYFITSELSPFTNQRVGGAGGQRCNTAVIRIFGVNDNGEMHCAVVVCRQCRHVFRRHDGCSACA